MSALGNLQDNNRESKREAVVVNQGPPGKENLPLQLGFEVPPV